MALSSGHHRACQTAPEADLRKAFPPVPVSREPGAVDATSRDAGSVLQERESSSIQGAVKELPGLQNASAAGITHLPWGQGVTRPEQEGVTPECAVSDLECGPASSDGSAKGLLDPRARPAPRKKEEKTLGGFLALGEWIRSHPMITLVLALLLFLVLALVMALAVQSDTPRLPACPDGWVGYRGICYLLSRDRRTWGQARAQCSKLGASLAVLRDEEMEFLFHFSKNIDYWLGLRRRRRELQWEDGSSFSSSVRVLGNAECVFLAEDALRSEICSADMPYLCSRAQTPL